MGETGNKAQRWKVILNWVTLGGAMHHLKRDPEIIDYVESYIFNSDKCFAVFRP